ncbi:MAG: o-succinylbenzoate synthase [Bacteroidota bacterium]
MKATVIRKDLQFITPGQTSRGTLYSKPSWFVILREDERTGTGECSVIPGLSPEYDTSLEDKIKTAVMHLEKGDLSLENTSNLVPSIRFALETALLDLQQPGTGVLHPSDFTNGKQGIAINGLVWMGTREEMKQRIKDKLNKGFGVLKLKVGALDFQEELSLLKEIRKTYPPEDLELRLDANGAFSPASALEKLKVLSAFHIHSVEQPIKPGFPEEMAFLCTQSPVPVALDEELIGINDPAEKLQLLETLQPRYIILKPSLTGGLEKSNEWIAIAEQLGIGWWATSALESNVGLNAIAQWVFSLKPHLVQGLGTGQVFSNNINSPLELKGSYLYYNPAIPWQSPAGNV